MAKPKHEETARDRRQRKLLLPVTGEDRSDTQPAPRRQAPVAAVGAAGAPADVLGRRLYLSTAGADPKRCPLQAMISRAGSPPAADASAWVAEAEAVAAA